MSAKAHGLWPWTKKLDLGAPPASTPIEDVRFVALDMETTGFKAGKDKVVSIGWVELGIDAIALSTARYFVLQGADVGHSATIHGITDTEVAAGAQAADVFAQFLDVLQGKALVAHFAHLELSFLQAHAGRPLDTAVVDTFALERRHMERMGTYPRGEDLRLPRVRQRYGLPAYHNHHALADAVGCAELLLAQAAHRPPRTLADLVVR